MSSYQSQRDQFLVHVTREGLPYATAIKLLRIATTINRLAELACSSEAADRDRVQCPAGTRYGRYIQGDDPKFDDPKYPCLCDTDTDQGVDGEPCEVHTKIPRIRLQDYQAEQRAIKAVPAGWRVVTEGDPRGYTLLVIPPSYAERNKGRDRHNLD